MALMAAKRKSNTKRRAAPAPDPRPASKTSQPGRNRPVMRGTVAPEVIEAVDREAAKRMCPSSRVIELCIRQQLELLPPPEPRPLYVKALHARLSQHLVSIVLREAEARAMAPGDFLEALVSQAARNVEIEGHPRVDG